MCTNIIFELSMHLDSRAFSEIIRHVSDDLEQISDSDDEFLDTSMISKGMLVRYRDSLYKKKITLIIDVHMLIGQSDMDSDKLNRKIKKRIAKYFDNEFTIEDFFLSRAAIITDINVGGRDMVSSYLGVLKRIRQVKGYSPTYYDRIPDSKGLCLKGNSNGVEFTIYDLEHCFSKVSKFSEQYKGILRSEVHLVKQKAISQITGTSDTTLQIGCIAENAGGIFLEVFSHIVPYGDFYKKKEACDLVRRKVTDARLSRLMLKLIALIPEKKSLLLAQKALNSRRVDEVMEEFARIGVSPVTISKRCCNNELLSIYDFLIIKT